MEEMTFKRSPGSCRNVSGEKTEHVRGPERKDLREAQGGGAPERGAGGGGVDRRGTELRPASVGLARTAGVPGRLAQPAARTALNTAPKKFLKHDEFGGRGRPF